MLIFNNYIPYITFIFNRTWTFCFLEECRSVKYRPATRSHPVSVGEFPSHTVLLISGPWILLPRYGICFLRKIWTQERAQCGNACTEVLNSSLFPSTDVKLKILYIIQLRFPNTRKWSFPPHDMELSNEKIPYTFLQTSKIIFLLSR